MSLDTNWRNRARQFFPALYPKGSSSDQGSSRFPLINVIRQFQSKNGKMVPKGGGLTGQANQWALAKTRGYVLEANELGAGTLFRINSVKGHTGRGGSGYLGAYTDADIEARQRMYVLVEIDELPMRWQLALWWHFRHYVVALTSSGRRSLHALLVIFGLGGAQDYRKAARGVTNYFRQFGCDQTDNASRLSRLPGAERSATADPADPYRLAGRQELLWLNPDAAFAHELLSKQQKHEKAKNERTSAGGQFSRGHFIPDED